MTDRPAVRGIGATAALGGARVMEVPGRLATRVCGMLLAQLGAAVEVFDGDAPAATDPFVQSLLSEGKGTATDASGASMVIADASVNARQRSLLDSLLGEQPASRVLCTLSTSGLPGTDPAGELGELGLQARAGVMAVTGEDGGAPSPVCAPVGEMLGGLVAATASLAAWRHRRLGGQPQRINLSLLEVMADQLRTQASLVLAGKTSGYRAGSRHPVCAPWNAYRAADGWVVICSASDAQWRALAGLIDPALAADPRFETVAQRRSDVDALDALIEQWTGRLTVQQIISKVQAIEVPAGPVATVAMLHRQALAADPAGGGVPPALRSPVRYTLFPARAGESSPHAAGTPSRPCGAAPLSGIRVVELSRYAAGPIAGTVLAALGAEVIKVEAPGGEDCRGWAPTFGDTSGYFANYNAGKRSVVLDLMDPAARDRLWTLLGSADVLLSNLRPGVIDRLGFDPATVNARLPRLVQAEISGYGRDGDRVAALDTVIQAQSGLLSLVGASGRPVRVGLSIADQVAGQFAAQGVVAALERRDLDGSTGLIDVPMIDAATWLTLAVWPRGNSLLASAVMLQAGDGWVVAETEPGVTVRAKLAGTPASRIVDTLATLGIGAWPVQEPGAVFADPVLAARGTIYRTRHDDGEAIPVLRVPLGLVGTPAIEALRFARLGADASLLEPAVDPR
ncbi:MAG: CoA transferase [Pseudomonadota bacterium]